MAYVCVIFTIWLVLNVLPVLFTTPAWFPYGLAVALGIAGVLLVEAENWWWGPGLAGIAAAIMMVTDLLLVTTDAIRLRVLARGGARR